MLFAVAPLAILAAVLVAPVWRWSEPVRVRVVARTTGAPLASYALPRARVGGSVAVSPDGTVALVAGPMRPRDRCDRRSVLLYTAGRHLASHVCDFGVGLAGGDVLVVRPARGVRVALVRLKDSRPLPERGAPSGRGPAAARSANSTLTPAGH